MTWCKPARTSRFRPTRVSPDVLVSTPKYDQGGTEWTGYPKAGSLKGKIWISEDFDEPIEESAGVHGMKLLLDTCVLLWFLADSEKLSGIARGAIEDPANLRLLSPISLLEIAIKLRIDKLRLDASFAVTFPCN